MTPIDQCLSEAEILEIASALSLNSQLSSHVRHCDACQRAVDRTRSELAQIQHLFDPSTQVCLDSIDTAQNVCTLPYSAGRATTPPPTIQPGTFIGKYRVKQLLGSGGLSVVYLVEHPDLGIDLAAKLCRRESLSERTAGPVKVNEALLKQEAALLAKLADAKHIARVYDIDVDERFGPYVIMEYVAARTLRQRMKEYTGDSNNAIQIIAKIADAVQEAHAKGIVHGDLKPENILVDDRDEVKLIDFGMGKIRDAWHLGESSEPYGGTPAYMPPEQANIESSRISPATDVFALGATLQELLTGKPPYQGSTNLEVLTSARNGRIFRASPSELPFPWLSELLSKSLAASPEDRYPTSGLFAAEIRKHHLNRPQRRSRLLSVLGGGTLIAAIMIYLLFFIPRDSNSLIVQTIPGILGAGQSPPGELQSALPIQLGATIRLSAIVPKNLEWFVVWIDGSRQVEVYQTNDQDFPIETQPVGEQGAERLYWPATPMEVTVGGFGGTEMVLLIGKKNPQETSQERIRQLIEAVLADPSRWPKLPPDVLIRCSSNDVQPAYAEGVSRSLAKAEATNRMQVEKSMQLMRQALKAECEFLLGEAFCVTAL